jgi:hypothetical protein
MLPKKTKVQTTIEATIIRADGTKIPLGAVHNTRWWWKFGPKQLMWIKIKRANRGVTHASNESSE